MLYQITLSYACFGIEIKSNKVVEVAPIGRWMIGKSFIYVCEWVNRKGGIIKQARKT